MSKESEELVKGVVGDFLSLEEEAKNRFIDDTLNGLIAIMENPKALKKLLKGWLKKGRPKQEDLEAVNQLLITFLYSLKDEYKYQWAEIIYAILRRKWPNLEFPEDLSAKMDKVKELKWLHLGVKPDIYDKLIKVMGEKNCATPEQLLNHLLTKGK